MIALVASFFSLFVGPLVYQTFGPLRRTDKIVGGMVLVIISGVILLDILPDSYKSIGIIALLLAAAGFAGPTLIERTFRGAADTTHKMTLYIGLLGLMLHALMDGAAIQSEASHGANGLTLAILVHRLPVGLTIWWLLKPILGERYALLMLLGMGLFTFAGYFLYQTIGQYDDRAIFAAVQSIVAGSLLHVVIYKPHADGCMHTSESHHDHSHSSNSNHEKVESRLSLSRWELLGIALGVIVLIFMHFTH
ncbi:hypothetical protein [Aliikangiella sp. G2MR2-5]|uniref:hypothetical protein n=1 Tax=Aliikangiella sp. G2MR2-5 TaxID=2788943 RepID=UPI0018A9ED4E|nr:hypothetical protein [Aliikangiella sp. G2MR2-5]